MGWEQVVDSPSAQVSVIGSMLIDPDCIGDVMAALSPDDFKTGPLQEAFRAIQRLFDAGKPIDGVTCVGEMGKSEDADTRAFIAQVIELTPTSANVMEYATIVKRQSKLSKLKEIGGRIANAESLEDTAPLIDRINHTMVDSKDQRGETMKESMERFFARIDKPKHYVEWGVDLLDAGLYIEPGDLVILAGYPSDGKTALSLQTGCFQAKSMNVGYFTLETGADKVTDRQVSHLAHVPLHRIKDACLTEDDCREIAARSQSIAELRLEKISAAGWTVQDIQSYTRAKKFNIIYIDYLQLIRSTGKSRVEEVTNISLNLHRMAQQTGVTIVALSQLSRAEKGRDLQKSPPRMNDLRESGQIEQDADAVIFVYREDPRKLDSRRFVNIAKNKEGHIGEMPFLFDGDYQTFTQDGVLPGYSRKKQPYEPVQSTFTELTETTPDMPF